MAEGPLTSTVGSRPDLTPDDYLSARELTEQLAAPLSSEDQMVQSMPDVSPTKWHRGHTTWFFEEFLLDSCDHYRRFHPQFGYVFNSYYEALGNRQPRAQRGLLSRPDAAEVRAYREYVDDAMVARVGRGELDDRLDLVVLGLHHEQQHQELLVMDIKHVLSCSPLDARYFDDAPPSSPSCSPPMRWISFDGGLVEVGHDGEGFSFDNERPRHAAYVVDFGLADRLITNREWLQFIDDGGYRCADLWLSDGWAAVNANGWRAPLYWTDEDGEWRTFTLRGSQPLVLDEPVAHVSYFEADAFARWAGARLPTEQEWEVAATRCDAPAAAFDATRLHPLPAATGVDLRQMMGALWQWTSSAYLPYPGFRTAAGAVGEYNGKFMVNQHVLRGGSCATPPGHLRETYRNFFPPSARWAFSGVRLAADAP